MPGHDVRNIWKSYSQVDTPAFQVLAGARAGSPTASGSSDKPCNQHNIAILIHVRIMSLQTNPASNSLLLV